MTKERLWAIRAEVRYGDCFIPQVIQGKVFAPSGPWKVYTWMYTLCDAGDLIEFKKE